MCIRDSTIAYHEYIMSVKDKIKLTFVKVKGHSGVEGNDEADKLAKQAVGIPVSYTHLDVYKRQSFHSLRPERPHYLKRLQSLSL